MASIHCYVQEGLCKYYFSKNGCKKVNGCDYSHNEEAIKGFCTRFFVTRDCDFEKRGVCELAHQCIEVYEDIVTSDEAEKKVIKSLKKTRSLISRLNSYNKANKICKYHFSKNGCKKVNGCDYSHNEEAIKGFCTRFFVTGDCDFEKRGECGLAHQCIEVYEDIVASDKAEKKVIKSLKKTRSLISRLNIVV